MAQNKKDFTAEAAGVFVNKMVTPTDEPRHATKTKAQAKPVATRKPQTNAAGDEVKVCYMLPAELDYKLRYIACVTRGKQKAIVTTALQDYVDNYEAVNGKIK